MKKYIIATTCHGYKGRMWEEGQIVELEDDDNPPRHFKLVDDFIPKIKIENVFDPQHPVPVDMKKPFIPAKPKGGFAHNKPEKVPVHQMTAGQALKNQK